MRKGEGGLNVYLDILDSHAGLVPKAAMVMETVDQGINLELISFSP